MCFAMKCSAPSTKQVGTIPYFLCSDFTNIPCIQRFRFTAVVNVNLPLYSLSKAKRRKGISALIENQLTMVPIAHGHFLGAGGLGMTSGQTPYGSVVTNRNGVGMSATLPTIMANTGSAVWNLCDLRGKANDDYCRM